MSRPNLGVFAKFEIKLYVIFYTFTEILYIICAFLVNTCGKSKMADNMCLTFCHVRTVDIVCLKELTPFLFFLIFFFSQDLILLPCCSFSAVFLQHNHQFFQRLHQHQHNLLITTDHNNQGTILNIPQGILLLIKLGHCPTL